MANYCWERGAGPRGSEMRPSRCPRAGVGGAGNPGVATVSGQLQREGGGQQGCLRGDPHPLCSLH